MTALAIADRSDLGFAAVLGSRRGAPAVPGGRALWLSQAEETALPPGEQYELRRNFIKQARTVRHKTRKGEKARDRFVRGLNALGPRNFRTPKLTGAGLADSAKVRYPNASHALHMLVRAATDRAAEELTHAMQALTIDFYAYAHMSQNARTEMSTSVSKALTRDLTNSAFADAAAGTLDFDTLIERARERFPEVAFRPLGAVVYRRRKQVAEQLGVDTFTPEQAKAAARAHLHAYLADDEQGIEAAVESLLWPDL